MHQETTADMPLKTKQMKLLTHTLLISSLVITSSLATLVIAYDIFSDKEFTYVIALLSIATLYLVCTLYILHRGNVYLASWMVIIFHSCSASIYALSWEIYASMSILNYALAILVTGALVGSRYLPYIATATIVFLIAVELARSLQYLPAIEIPQSNHPSWSATGCIVSLAMLSLVAWFTSNLTETSLARARKAERTIRAQKEAIQLELARESSLLRQEQLQKTQQLYRFALIGQSTTALLHEMSSRLSVINLDLDDLKLQIDNSEAIKNTEQSIHYINRMVVSARKHLTSYSTKQPLDLQRIIEKSVKDVQLKKQHSPISIQTSFDTASTHTLTGDPMALTQVISILLNNACEACMHQKKKKVTIATQWINSIALITISDTGHGIPTELKDKLFSPLTSSKQDGLGVGLYIARHIVETYFSGSIYLAPNDSGVTTFAIELPSATKK